MIPGTSADRVRVRTRTGNGGAVKVIEVGIHDGYIIRAREIETILVSSIAASRAPSFDRHDVLARAFLRDRDQGCAPFVPDRPCQSPIPSRR